jgi:small-conductance mechanosensitive channel
VIWTRLFTRAPDWHLLAAAVIPTMLVAWMAGRWSRRAGARVLQQLLSDTILPSSAIVRAPLRLIGFATFLLVFAVLIFPAFELAGLQPRTGMRLGTLNNWAFDSGLRVLLIAAVAFVIVRMVGVGVKRFEHDINFGTGLDALERAKRARTLGSVLTNITTVVVLLIAVLMVLHEFKVDISPALTGAGIVGVALGFGAQTLVKDLIGGFFLILENQVRVGDVVSINGTGGLVEAINLRTTVLRDEEGTVHIFPNGNIETLANRSMNFRYYVVNLPLAYGEDTDEASAVLRDTADALGREDAYAPFILEPLEIIGVDAFEENAVRLKVRVKTAPLKQWFVGRELRRRILKALEDRGIEMWSPQRTLALNTRQGPAAPSSAPRTPGQS